MNMFLNTRALLASIDHIDPFRSTALALTNELDWFMSAGCNFGLERRNDEIQRINLPLCGAISRNSGETLIATYNPSEDMFTVEIINARTLNHKIGEERLTGEMVIRRDITAVFSFVRDGYFLTH